SRLGLSSSVGAALAVWESRATEVRAAVARAGVRMPATRVPGVRDLRCDAKGGDSFQCSAYRVSCRVRAVVLGRVALRPLREGVGRFTPCVSVGHRLRLPRGTGTGTGGAARRGEVRRWGSYGPHASLRAGVAPVKVDG